MRKKSLIIIIVIGALVVVGVVLFVVLAVPQFKKDRIIAMQAFPPSTKSEEYKHLEERVEYRENQLALNDAYLKKLLDDYEVFKQIYNPGVPAHRAKKSRQAIRIIRVLCEIELDSLRMKEDQSMMTAAQTGITSSDDPRFKGMMSHAKNAALRNTRAIFAAWSGDVVDTLFKKELSKIQTEMTAELSND